MEDMIRMLQLTNPQQEQLAVYSCNDKTENFGLSLTQEDARELVLVKNESLRKYQRVEFGESILTKLIFEFCDSKYLNQENYVQELERLQDIFYRYKNESGDKVTDEELLAFMKEQYEGVCCGDAAYLEETCLERFSKAVRAGYGGHRRSGGHGEYAEFDEETRWDSEVYQKVMRELFWE